MNPALEWRGMGRRVDRMRMEYGIRIEIDMACVAYILLLYLYFVPASSLA
jgi:hypothetical protein